MVNSKEAVCNLALSHMGNFSSINNIDTPKTDKEKIFALWYDLTRKTSLKTMKPNFCLDRRVIAKAGITPIESHFANAYEYPSDALAILGINGIDAKEKNYTIESQDGIQYIFIDDDFPNGMPIRFVKDFEDVARMSPEFLVQLSWDLAINVALPITQDVNKMKAVIDIAPVAMANTTALNAQENPPVRKSNSKFRQSRHTLRPVTETKK